MKNPPAMQETQARSLGHKDPLEEEMATHSSIPAWRVPWTEEPGGLQSMGILQARILEWVAMTPPGDLPNPGIEPRSPALQVDSLPAELSGKNQELPSKH